MAIIRMPEIATGDTTAVIAGWLVTLNEEVSQGQAIVEIETEKATVEFEAEVGGKLLKILCDAGNSVEVGTPIAVIAAPGESSESALAELAEVHHTHSVEAGHSQESSEESRESPELQPQRNAQDTQRNAENVQRLFASPLVRKLAKEWGLDLFQLEGTGPAGRIVRRDIERYRPNASNVSQDSGETVLPEGPGTAPLSYTDIPHTGMRRAIARRLTESKQSIPHFYLSVDCRVNKLLKLRSEINSIETLKVSVNDLIIAAVGGAFRDVPQANAIWMDDVTRQFDTVDVAVAVAVPSGLVTPVVRGIDQLNLRELTETMSDLISRARDGKLKQHELEGGTFAVSNLGMYGTREFSAIINPPQSGILAVGAADLRPVVSATGELEIAKVMTVTLSADHRVIDGALAAQWLEAFKRRIESPVSVLV